MATPWWLGEDLQRPSPKDISGELHWFKTYKPLERTTPIAIEKLIRIINAIKKSNSNIFVIDNN